MNRLHEVVTSAVTDRRAPWIAAIVALLAALATMTSDPIGVFNDDGIYLLTARAIAEGQGYVYPHLPGTPAAIHYPPLWPVLLAAVWKVAPAFPENIAWFKLINPLVLAGAAAGTTIFARRSLGMSPLASFAAVVIATVSVPVLLLTNLLLSEPLFLALLIPTLSISERAARDGRLRTAAIAAALVAVLVLVRTLGGTVLIATVLCMVHQRRWRAAGMYVGVAGLLLLPWQLFVWRAAVGFPDELRGSYGPYLEWVAAGYRDGGLAFLGAVLAKNLSATWTMLGIFTSGLVGFGVRHLTAFLTIASLVTGLAVLARRDRLPVTALAIAGYLAIVISWPFWVDRFLWVLWPLLVVITVSGLLQMGARWRAAGRGRAALAMTAVVATLSVGHVAYNVLGLRDGWASKASSEMTAAGMWDPLESTCRHASLSIL